MTHTSWEIRDRATGCRMATVTARTEREHTEVRQSMAELAEEFDVVQLPAGTPRRWDRTLTTA